MDYYGRQESTSDRVVRDVYTKHTFDADLNHH
jgi:hypothetical protein